MFKTRAFARFANHEGLDDATLYDAIRPARGCMVGVDLGRGVLMQRIFREGGGGSDGFWTIVLCSDGIRAFYIYGFANSAGEDLRPDELAAFRMLADEYLALDRTGLVMAQAIGAIIEVECSG